MLKKTILLLAIYSGLPGSVSSSENNGNWHIFELGLTTADAVNYQDPEIVGNTGLKDYGLGFSFTMRYYKNLKPGMYLGFNSVASLLLLGGPVNEVTNKFFGGGIGFALEPFKNAFIHADINAGMGLHDIYYWDAFAAADARWRKAGFSMNYQVGIMYIIGSQHISSKKSALGIFIEYTFYPDIVDLSVIHAVSFPRFGVSFRWF